MVNGNFRKSAIRKVRTESLEWNADVIPSKFSLSSWQVAFRAEVPESLRQGVANFIIQNSAGVRKPHPLHHFLGLNMVGEAIPARFKTVLAAAHEWYLKDLTFTRLNEHFGPSTYDTLYGAVGIDSYFHWTEGRHGSEKFPPVHQTLKDYIYRQLRIGSQGIWFPSHDEFKPNGDFYQRQETDDINLGLAHGILGIGMMLARSHRHWDEMDGLVFESIIDLALRVESECQDGFPNLMSAKRTRKHQNGWCYGDLSLGWFLIRSAAYLKEQPNAEVINSEGVRIMKRGMRRALAGMQDAYFCHGYTGALFMLWRSFELTGEQEFLNACPELLDKALSGLNFEFYKGATWSNCFLTGHSSLTEFARYLETGEATGTMAYYLID
jgi:hypothetical protein